MSHITINSDNISRFNKRLQKALQKHFNQEVQLHTASTLFANALGVDGEFQLKKSLDTPTITKKNISDPYTVKAQSLITELTEYFKNNQSTLSSVTISYIYKHLAINIVSRSKKYPEEEEGFGLYFDDNPITSLEKELSHLQYSKEDKKFLEYICRTYFNEDIAENIFLGSRLAKIYDLNSDNNNIVNIYSKN